MLNYKRVEKNLQKINNLQLYDIFRNMLVHVMELYIVCTPTLFRDALYVSYKLSKLLMALISMVLGLYAWENDPNVARAVSVANLRSIIVLVVCSLVTVQFSVMIRLFQVYMQHISDFLQNLFC